MTEVFTDAAAQRHDGGGTHACASVHSRSTVSTAASTSETISSNEDVHSYEDWELGSDADDAADNTLSNREDDTEDDDNDDDLESSTASASPTSHGSARSSVTDVDNAADQDDGERWNDETTSSEAHHKDPIAGDQQSLQPEDEGTHRDAKHHESGIESARFECERSTGEVDTAETLHAGAHAPRSSRVITRHQECATADTHLESAAVTSSNDKQHKCEVSHAPQRASTASSARSHGSNEQTAEPQQRPPVQQNIQVFVRVRPLSARNNEYSDDAASVVQLGGACNSIRVQSSSSHGHNNCVVTECSFDRVFTESSSQEDVFAAVQTSIHAVLGGYNATVFAYGQTGTGKTHTIFGDDSDAGAAGECAVRPGWGIIPRVLALLLDQAHEQHRMGVHVSLQCSFMQIYNDRLFDLLTDRRRQRPLLIREQPTLEGGTSVVLQGLSSERVATLDDALQLLRRGRTNRSVRETELNASSSRSHAIVQLNLVSECALANGETLTRKSRLNLVDLAGSEKWNTDVEMEDAHSFELKTINASLSALGNCIAALSEAGRRHIPYRDSTLTRVLQDSFGGNTQACLIATVSPSARACDETIRTLQFADRARSVMQSVRVNETLSGVSELQIAKAQIAKLRERLESEQRRRHQTRVKEHETAQREFLEKLQSKEKELQKLTRDNAVFARWRDEDVKRIRELETRVKELEGAGRLTAKADSCSVVLSDALDGNDTGRRRAHTDSRHPEAKSDVEQYHAPSTPAKAGAATPTLAIRKVDSKKSITSSGGASATAAKKSDPHAAKPYRLILERYALGSKSSHQRQQQQGERQQQDEHQLTGSPHSHSQPIAHVDNNRNAGHHPERQVLGDTGASPLNVLALASNQRLHNQRSLFDTSPLKWDASRGFAVFKSESSPLLLPVRRALEAPEIERTPVADAHSIDELSSSSNSNSNSNHVSSLPSTTFKASSVWNLSQVGSSAINPAAPSASSVLELSAPSNFANWRSANVSDQSYRSALPPHAPTPALAASDPVVRRTDPESLVRVSTVFASSGSKLVSPEPAMQSLAGSVASLPFHTTFMISSAEPCAKHSLRGCVLCAARDTRPPFASSTVSSLVTIAKSSSTAELALSTSSLSKPTVAAARDVPCDRHQLANCFICGSSIGAIASSNSSLGQSSSGLSSSSVFKLASRKREDNPSDGGGGPGAAAAERAPVVIGDSKCEVHALANCVLCAGAKAMASKIQQASPVRRALPLDESPLLSSATAWTSSQSPVVPTRSPPAVHPSVGVHPSHAVLTRRHSVDYASGESSESGFGQPTSPTKLLAQLRPQQSAVNLHSQALVSAGSYTQAPLRDAVRSSDGDATTATAAVAEPLRAQPVRPSWHQQPAARASIKELAHDSRRSYEALIREASDASASALGRKM